MYDKKFQIKATLLVALSGILYGFMGFFGTEIIKEKFSVETMLFWRFLIAAAWMFTYAAFKQEKFLSGWSAPPKLILPFIISAICYAGSSGFYFLASKQTGTGLAMVLFFCYPIFVAAIAWAQKSWRMNKYSFASLAAIVFGLILLKGSDKSPVTITGIILGMISAFSYALYIIRSKRMVNTMHSSYFTIIICLNCAMVFFVIACATHSFALPSTSSSWFYILAIGIIATAIPIQLLLEGLKIISPLKVSIISVLEPVVTLIVGMSLLSESITSLQLLGIVILLLGAIVIQFVRE